MYGHHCTVIVIMLYIHTDHIGTADSHKNLELLPVESVVEQDLLLGLVQLLDQTNALYMYQYIINMVTNSNQWTHPPLS